LVTEWNAKTTEISGFSKADTQGKHLVNTFIHAEFREEVAKVLQDAQNGKECTNFLLPLFTKDNKRREVLLNATPHRGEDGFIVGVLAVGQDITELNQQRNEALRIADDLGRIIETANAPIFGIDVRGHVTEWNLKLAKLSCFSKEEALGKSLVLNFIDERCRELVGHVLFKAMNDEHTSSFELPLVKDGEVKAVVLLNATTRWGQDNEITGVICVGQDITEINRMKEEVAKTADNLARLVDGANAPIFGVDVNGMVTEWNKKAAELVGYSKAETMGQHLVKNFIQPENRKSVEEVLSRALAGLETANYTVSLRGRSGGQYDVLLNATTRRDAKGQIIGVVGVGQDITEINKASAETKRMADDLMRLIETANAPIFGIDTEGKVTEWNAKASSLLGYSKLEALGKSLVQNFINEEFKDSVNKVLQEALNGRETANFGFPMFTKDDERREILLNATTRRGPNNEITGVIGVGQDITQIREMNEEQSRVADDLSRLIESANAPIFGVDPNGMVTEWNRKAADILGYTREETIGKHLVGNFIQPENRESVKGVLERALTGEETANYELPLLSKTQKRLTVLLNATTRRDARGQITGVVGVGQDITALNKLMEDAQRVADDLTRIIETANAPIFGINTKGEVTEWNRRMTVITKYSKEEAAGRHLVKNFITKAYSKQVEQVLQAAMQGVETANFEFPLFTKSGDTKVQILMSATPRRGPDGKIIGMIAVGQDITQLKAATEEADRTANELSRLIDSANAPIFGVDGNYCLTEWNQMMMKISGVPREEVIGKAFNVLFDRNAQESINEIKEVLKDALTGVDRPKFEMRFNRRVTEQSRSQDSQVVLLLSATARLDSSGSIVGVVSIGQDITEHKLLEEKKMNFVAVVSHELRSPIHGICGLSDALSASELDPKRAKQLSMIRTCSGRLLDLVTNIMDVSSMQSKKLKLTKRPCNLGQIVEETVQLLTHATNKRGVPVMSAEVECVNDIKESLPLIQADVHRVTQVFYNLVMNAMKFTSKGSIRISALVDRANDQVKVLIKDTGIGIASEHLGNIFSPFEQEDDADGKSFEGIGLGLAISREVVERHAGTITVESTLGVGSTFTVCLPIHDTTKPGKEEEETNPEKPVQKKVLKQAQVAEFCSPQSRKASAEERGTALPRSDSAQRSNTESSDFNHIPQEAERTLTLTDDSSLAGSEAINVLHIDATSSSEKVVKNALTTIGVNVITTTSINAAMKTLSQGTLPHLVLFHAAVPRPSCEEIFRCLREELKLSPSKVPVITISNKSSAVESSAETFISGPDCLVPKQFTPEELVLRVQMTLQVRTGYINASRQDRHLHLLQVALPKHVSRQLLVRHKMIAEELHQVALLYCRVTNWSSLSYALGTRKTVEIACEVLGHMERLGGQQSIYLSLSLQHPIIAVCGHDGNNVRCLEKILQFVSSVIKATQDICSKHQIQMRMGLHVGHVQAGMVGTGLPRYSLFGESLDIAQTIETTCPPGCVHLSDQAKHQMGEEVCIDGASLFDQGEMQIESYGQMRTWVIVPKSQQTNFRAWQKEAKAKQALKKPVAMLAQTPAPVSRQADLETIDKLRTEVEALQTQLQLAEGKMSQMSQVASTRTVAIPQHFHGTNGHSPAHNSQMQDEISSQWSGTGNTSKVNELLRGRVESLKKEVSELKSKLRESNRDLVLAGAELQAMKAEVEDAWKQVMHTDESMLKYKSDFENTEDRLALLTS